MKTRTAFLLLSLLSFLLVSAGSGNAQITPLTPSCDISITFEHSSVTYDLNQKQVTPEIVSGSLVVPSIFCSSPMTLTIGIHPPTNWITQTKIDGNVVQNGSLISVSAGQTLPVEVTLTPNTESNNIDTFGIGFLYGGKGIALLAFITLNTTNGTSAVSADPHLPNIILEPNPAENYMFVRGLSSAQTGYRYEIFSTSGADVRQALLPADARINLQDLPSGAYRLLLFDGKRTIANSAFTVVH